MWVKAIKDGVVRYRRDGWLLSFFPAHFDCNGVWHQGEWQLVSEEKSVSGAFGPYGYGASIAEAKAYWREAAQNTVADLVQRLAQV